MPIDVDYLALRFAHGIDARALPEGIPALTVNGRIVLHRGLNRRLERWYGCHELYHSIESGPDQRPYIGTDDPVLVAEEAAADRFRLDLLMPAGEVLDALSEELTAEEWGLRFGLPWPILASRVDAVLKLWAA